jgi:CheY-like chemotaxis protein
MGHGQQKGPDILLVEDMQKHVVELVEGLQDEGYRVDIRTTAEDAVAALESCHCAALLLDIELPLGEASQPVLHDSTPSYRAGVEVLKRLRDRPQTAELPVIVVSGLDNSAFWPAMVRELTSEELHVTAIVVKPTGLREVIRELSRVTGWKGPLYRAFLADDPGYSD